MNIVPKNIHKKTHHQLVLAQSISDRINNVCGRIWSCDESGIGVNPISCLVLSDRGDNHMLNNEVVNLNGKSLPGATPAVLTSHTYMSLHHGYSLFSEVIHTTEYIHILLRF